MLKTTCVLFSGFNSRSDHLAGVLSRWTLVQLLGHAIVSRGDWLWSPVNLKGANKDAKICLGRSTTVQNLLFCAHTLCMNYVTNTFLLVSSSVRSKQLLCFVHGQGQKSEQKHTTKNFEGFHNHSPLLTMLKLKERSISNKHNRLQNPNWQEAWSVFIQVS